MQQQAKKIKKPYEPKSRGGGVCEREYGADADALLRVTPLARGATEHSQGTTEEVHASVCGKNYAYHQYLLLHMIGCGGRRFVSSRHRLLWNTRVISARQTISSHEYTHRMTKHIRPPY